MNELNTSYWTKFKANARLTAWTAIPGMLPSIYLGNKIPNFAKESTTKGEIISALVGWCSNLLTAGYIVSAISYSTFNVGEWSKIREQRDLTKELNEQSELQRKAFDLQSTYDVDSSGTLSADEFMNYYLDANKKVLNYQRPKLIH